MKKYKFDNNAFTIVELLIVIIIIGILATITVVSYTGIAKKAKIAAIQSDLTTASKKIKLYQVDHDVYPASLGSDNCPRDGSNVVDNMNCIKASPGTTLVYESDPPYKEFKLSATNSGISYRITDDQGPFSVEMITISSINPITGATLVGSVLTAGTIEPYSATVDYQWKSSTSSNGTYTDIPGARSNTYTLTTNEIGKYIKVSIVGNGDSYGDVTSQASSIVISPTPIASIGAITGTVRVGQTLTVGAITPSGATVTYQWQNAVAAGGPYTNLTSATTTYVLRFSDIGKYIRVIATGSGGYSGSATSSITPVVSAISDGLVTVGSQVWAATNLNAGTMISGSTSQTNNGVVEKYCYNDDPAYCAAYGGLYMWDEMMQYSTTEGIQGVCPVGFRVPTDNDWKVLEVYLGMTQAQADLYGWRGTDQATKLKIGGSSGLNLPPAGLRVGTSFAGIDTDHDYWTSSIAGTNHWRRYLSPIYTTIGKDGGVPNGGLSVRCLKN